MTEPINDNSAPFTGGSPEPDAHGQAAMLLVESLIHGLIARSVISVEQAVAVVHSAADVAVEIAREYDGAGRLPQAPATLLTSIADSLRLDLRGS